LENPFVNGGAAGCVFAFLWLWASHRRKEASDLEATLAEIEAGPIED
jgi:hypothetical protein